MFLSESVVLVRVWFFREIVELGVLGLGSVFAEGAGFGVVLAVLVWFGVCFLYERGISHAVGALVVDDHPMLAIARRLRRRIVLEWGVVCVFLEVLLGLLPLLVS